MVAIELNFCALFSCEESETGVDRPAADDVTLLVRGGTVGGAGLAGVVLRSGAGAGEAEGVAGTGVSGTLTAILRASTATGVAAATLGAGAAMIEAAVCLL